MKILFVTGKYSPGKCGISDYLHLFSRELESRGHKCQIFSVNPNGLSTFRSLRAPLPDSDLVSLQFAPYSFSSSGICGKDLTCFAETLAGRMTQVLFHEIWIGAYPGASWLESFRGWRQRREIVDFLATAEPRWIHATNAAALDRLKVSGIDARYLYLFGNVPFDPASVGDEKNDPNFLDACIFGTVYESFPLEKAMQILQEAARNSNRVGRLKVLGRQRESPGMRKLEQLSRSIGLPLEKTGELSTRAISHHLQTSDLGISSTPFDVLGKSGATAAMLEHGLCVLCHDDGDTPRDSLYAPGPFAERIILLSDPGATEKIGFALKSGKRSFFNGLSHTADQFCETIAPVS